MSVIDIIDVINQQFPNESDRIEAFRRLDEQDRTFDNFMRLGLSEITLPNAFFYVRRSEKTFNNIMSIFAQRNTNEYTRVLLFGLLPETERTFLNLSRLNITDSFCRELAFNYLREQDRTINNLRNYIFPSDDEMFISNCFTNVKRQEFTFSNLMNLNLQEEYARLNAFIFLLDPDKTGFNLYRLNLTGANYQYALRELSPFQQQIARLLDRTTRQNNNLGLQRQQENER